MNLRPYQQEIVRNVEEGLRNGGIGQIHMACGSGKTIVGQRAAEELLPAGGTVAVLVPSLALAAQTLAAWGRNGRQPLDALAMCSDDTVADAAVHAAELPVPVTTCVEKAADWLRRPSLTTMRLVLCTYLSAPRLADAVLATNPLDLLILDEAHHLTGNPDSATREILLADRLPSRRRLYMTATPRVDLRGNIGPDSPPMVGMDDVKVFGPVLGRYSFAQGISEGYLEDYRITVIGVRDSEARELLASEDVEYVDAVGAPALRTVVAQVALGRAREWYGIRRALTFHPRIDTAAEFSRTLGINLARAVPTTRDGLYAAHVHGEMDHRLRERILSHLGRADDGWTVISNARCLGEGVDLPAVDAILFGHPKRSMVDISQAVGRALRRDPQVPGVSTIIVPLVVPDEGDEINDLDPGDYETLWQTVRALRAHDDSLGIALDNQRRYEATEHESRLPKKITVMLPPGTSTNFLTKVKLMLVRQTTSPWWEGYHEAVCYYDEHGHLRVPADHRTESGFRLGSWVAQRRYNFRLGQLTADRVEKLEAIGMVWDPGAEAFARNLDAAARYRTEHGQLCMSAPPELRNWLSKQRGLRRRGKLAREKEAALDALGVVWKLDPAAQAWEAGLNAARLFHREHGHLNVPRLYQTDSGHRLGDWLNTQRIKRRKGALPVEQEIALGDLGMVWDREDARWRQVYDVAREYHAEYGHLRVPHAYTAPDGTRLGAWVLHQRQLFSGVKKGGIVPERVESLEAIGMRW